MQRIYLAVMVGALALFSSCGKDKTPDAPQPTLTELDPPLSAADLAVLDAAPNQPADLTVVQLDNGQSVKDFMLAKDPTFFQQYGQRQTPGAIPQEFENKEPSRRGTAGSFSREEQKMAFIARMTLMASYLSRDDLHTFPAGPDPVVQPSQTGLGYRYGSRNHTVCDFPDPLYSVAACRTKKFRGVDCSGMIYEMYMEAGIDVIPGGKVYVEALTDTAKWNRAFRRSTEFQSVIVEDKGRLAPADMKTGDIILWPGHIGMMVGSVLYQSAGSPSEPGCLTSLDANRGPLSKPIAAINLNTFYKGVYKIFRPALKSPCPSLTAEEMGLLVGNTGTGTKRWRFLRYTVNGTNIHQVAPGNTIYVTFNSNGTYAMPQWSAATTTVGNTTYHTSANNGVFNTQSFCAGNGGTGRILQDGYTCRIDELSASVLRVTSLNATGSTYVYEYAL
jgi:hypothetical protein